MNACIDHAPRVLVIDDDEMTRALVAETLEPDGFQVDQAATGADGLTIFQCACPDLVLLDLNMPGMSGFECCERIRQLPQAEHVPIVVLTAQNDDRSITEAYEARATDFIAKPISWQLLNHRVRYLLRSSAALESLARNEASLAHAQALAQLGSWEWQTNAPQARWSAELSRMLGRDSSDRRHTLATFLDHIPEDERLPLASAFARLLKQGESYTLEHRVVRRDGTERIVLQQADAVLDGLGRTALLRGTVQDITERKRQEAQLGYLATHDVLTGLPNRVLLLDRMQQAISYAQRHQRQVAIVFVDLDRFKFVNDSLGHSLGDQVLKAVADRLREALRDSDTVARWGGDEFVLVVNDQNTDDILFQTIKRILPTIARPVVIASREICVTCSMGISVYPRDGDAAETLLKNADMAMFRSKSKGGDCFNFFTADLTASIDTRVAMESSLRRALEREEFLLHYQPQVDLATGAIVGLEALIRWQHPERGMVPPGEFIPLAEEIGLISPIGEWVLKTASAQAKAWQDAGMPALPIAVNLSARQFADARLVETVATVLRDTGLPAQCLELELTESVSMDRPELTIGLLRQLKDMGVRIAIDDFGTGYSNLSYLKYFPVDRLKLDRSFTCKVAHDPHDVAICRAVIAMAHSLGMRVVAEGVETAAQLAVLGNLGADEMQGYYFSRPLAPADCAALLQSGRRLALPDSGPAHERVTRTVDGEAPTFAALREV
jgi:diguanylate cyclase (GGDEF)-like protein